MANNLIATKTYYVALNGTNGDIGSAIGQHR
jgi:hypothetical protein